MTFTFPTFQVWNGKRKPHLTLYNSFPAGTWRYRYNVALTSIRHVIASTLMWRCVNAMSPLGSSILQFCFTFNTFQSRRNISHIAKQIDSRVKREAKTSHFTLYISLFLFQVLLLVSHISKLINLKVWCESKRSPFTLYTSCFLFHSFASHFTQIKADQFKNVTCEEKKSRFTWYASPFLFHSSAQISYISNRAWFVG